MELSRSIYNLYIYEFREGGASFTIKRELARHRPVNNENTRYLVTGYHKASVSMTIGDFNVGSFIDEKLDYV